MSMYAIARVWPPLKAYVLCAMWGGLGAVWGSGSAWAGEVAAKQAHEVRELIHEVHHKLRAPSSAAHRIETLKAHKAASVWLLEMLQRPMEKQERQRLVELLCLLAHPVATPYLLSALSSEDAYVRMLSATALGRLKAKAALPKLVDMLRDERLALRREAATALGRLGVEAATKPLLAALQAEEEPEVRERILWALGMQRESQAVLAMEGFLTHASESTRWAAARALLSMGELSGWKWLKPHLGAKESRECAYALQSLEGLVPGKSWKAEALAALHKIMKEREAPLAASAAALAVRWGDKAASAWLEKKREQAQGAEKSTYEEALEKARAAPVERTF